MSPPEMLVVVVALLGLITYGLPVERRHGILPNTLLARSLLRTPPFCSAHVCSFQYVSKRYLYYIYVGGGARYNLLYLRGIN